MRKGKFSYARALSVIILLPGFVVLLNTDLIAADTLEKVKKNGVLVAGVKDATPGFGFVDEKTGELTGYDVDFVKAIANRLGVKIKLVPVTSANRIQKLKEGSIDIIAATMTKTPERARQIDFSYIYFVSGQKRMC